MHRTYLGLGTNLGNRAANIDRAIALLQQQVGPLVKCSSYISSKPWGFSSDNDFLNAAAIFDTTLTPLHLLRATQAIEQQMGRTKKSKGSRVKGRESRGDRTSLCRPHHRHRHTALRYAAANQPRAHHSPSADGAARLCGGSAGRDSAAQAPPRARQDHSTTEKRTIKN